MLDTNENKRLLLKQKAKRELHEYEEEIPTSLEQLRRIITDELHLNCPTDEKYLLRFLRARKFDLDKTKKIIHRYYDMRLRNAELFKDLCPESISHVLSEEIQTVMGKRDSQGRQVFIFRAGKWNPDTVNLDDVFRSNYLFLEEMTSTEETQICGIVAIVDFEGMGFYQARQFTPRHAIRMVQIIQDSFPCRFQEFHIINQPHIFNFVFTVVKPFLSEKIKKRIYLHGRDMESLHDKVDPAILPDFMGGSEPLDETVRKFNQKFLRRNQHYKDLLQYGYISNQ